MSSLDTRHEMPAHATRLLALSPDLLGACGFDGYVKLLNPAWARTLGYTGEGLPVARYIEFVHPEDRDATERVVAGLAQGGRTDEFVCRVRRRDGEYRWLLWSAQGSPEDGCFYVAGKDITERMQLEDELNRRAARLERINAELQEFAYIASHDLSEPLRMITSYLELLERRYGDRLDETAGEFIAFAVDGAERMKALIDDLLAYSRVGSHDLELDDVDLAELLGQVLRSLGPAIEEAGATVAIPDVLPAVRGDATQLGQLLQNLIANAVKFRAPGRPPRVTLGARDDGSGLRLWVADDGIGIAEAHQERIFKMFARLHGRDEYEGTGIGLALCRRIAERHGGRIWVEPGAAGGSVFHVWIPSS
jgi:PAS domain S-box-containing protein